MKSVTHLLGTIFRSGIIHICCSGECVQQQGLLWSCVSVHGNDGTWDITWGWLFTVSFMELCSHWQPKDLYTELKQFPLKAISIDRSMYSQWDIRRAVPRSVLCRASAASWYHSCWCAQAEAGCPSQEREMEASCGTYLNDKKDRQVSIISSLTQTGTCVWIKGKYIRETEYK